MAKKGINLIFSRQNIIKSSFIVMIDFCCCWYYQLLWGHDKDRPVITDRTHPSGFDSGADYWSWLLISGPLQPCKLNVAQTKLILYTIDTDHGDPQDCLLVGTLHDWFGHYPHACKPSMCMNSCLGCYIYRWLMFHFFEPPVSRELVYRSEELDPVKREASNLGWARKVVQSL